MINLIIHFFQVCVCVRLCLCVCVHVRAEKKEAEFLNASTVAIRRQLS